MDSLIRFFAYIVLGAVILLCNIWYLRALRSLFDAREYAIMPIKVVGKEDADNSLGIALAQMLQARLQKLQRDLTNAHRQLTSAASSLAPPQTSPANALSVLPLISAKTVNVPTNLLQLPDINLSLGAVKVTGAVAWLQNLLARQRTLTFTLYSSDQNTTIVAGDAQALSGAGGGSIWIQTSGSQEKVISHLAYALLMKRVTSVAGKRIDDLIALEDFEGFVDGLSRAAALNQRIVAGESPNPQEFESAFQSIEPMALKVTGWPELTYFAALLAERAGEGVKAKKLYIAFKKEAALPGASAEVISLVNDGTVDTRLASLAAQEGPRPGHTGKFDWVVTKQGSTDGAVVYYETELGSAGSEIAQAVLRRVQGDLDRLSGFFGGIKLPQPLNIVLASIAAQRDGSGGAYHYECDAPDMYVSVAIEPKVDSDLSNFLIVSQAVDNFGAARAKGWVCGSNDTSGLKRVLATELYPEKLGSYATASAWLDSRRRANYVDTNPPTEVDPVATGCAVLFLNYLHTQLKIPWEEIVQAGGTTLAQTYANLGLGKDAFGKFRRLIDAHFPAGKPSRLVNDNPFPLDGG